MTLFNNLNVYLSYSCVFYFCMCTMQHNDLLTKYCFAWHCEWILKYENIARHSSDENISRHSSENILFVAVQEKDYKILGKPFGRFTCMSIYPLLYSFLYMWNMRICLRIVNVPVKNMILADRIEILAINEGCHNTVLSILSR